MGIFTFNKFFFSKRVHLLSQIVTLISNNERMKLVSPKLIFAEVRMYLHTV